MFDRLITNDYSHSGVETLMLDRKKPVLPGARRL